MVSFLELLISLSKLLNFKSSWFLRNCWLLPNCNSLFAIVFCNLGAVYDRILWKLFCKESLLNRIGFFQLNYSVGIYYRIDFNDFVIFIFCIGIWYVIILSFGVLRLEIIFGRLRFFAWIFWLRFFLWYPE